MSSTAGQLRVSPLGVGLPVAGGILDLQLERAEAVVEAGIAQGLRIELPAKPSREAAPAELNCIFRVSRIAQAGQRKV